MRDTDTDQPAYLADVDAAAQEIGVLAFRLAQVVQLAEISDGMTAGPLREEIRQIAGAVRTRVSIQRAIEATS